MPLCAIDDLEDPRLGPYRNLPAANPVRWAEHFVVEGHLLVERLVASRFPVESVLVDQRRLDLVPPALTSTVPVLPTAPGLVERIIGFNFHRGILACGRRLPATRLADGLSGLVEPLTIVACLDVHDPTNLGGMLRNCAAFGVQAVLLNPRCADPFSRRVLRVSMGAPLQLNLIQSAEIAEDLHELRDRQNVQLAATVLDEDAETLPRAARPPRLALLFGNEGYGLDADIIRFCQRRLTIPMAPPTDSLNAAVASGIFLYHFTRSEA